MYWKFCKIGAYSAAARRGLGRKIRLTMMVLQLTKTHSSSLYKLCSDSLYTWRKLSFNIWPATFPQQHFQWPCPKEIKWLPTFPVALHFSKVGLTHTDLKRTLQNPWVTSVHLPTARLKPSVPVKQVQGSRATFSTCLCCINSVKYSCSPEQHTSKKCWAAKI